MRTIISILIPTLILGVFCSIQDKQTPKVTYNIVKCIIDTTNAEEYCKLQNYQLIWSKPN